MIIPGYSTFAGGGVTQSLRFLVIDSLRFSDLSSSCPAPCGCIEFGEHRTEASRGNLGHHRGHRRTISPSIARSSDQNEMLLSQPRETSEPTQVIISQGTWDRGTQCLLCCWD